MRLFFILGMYDGNIAVYNLQVNPTQPIYDSTGMAGKHKDAVWEVKIFEIYIIKFKLCYLLSKDKMGSGYARWRN